MAKSGGRHNGVYQEAMTYPEKRLLKAIDSHMKQVEEHYQKLKHPELGDKDWYTKKEYEKAGLIKKWKKDAQRNGEQAAIERLVYEERFW